MTHRGYECDWCRTKDCVIPKAIENRMDIDLGPATTTYDLCQHCLNVFKSLAYIFYRKAGFDGGASKDKLEELVVRHVKMLRDRVQ